MIHSNRKDLWPCLFSGIASVLCLWGCTAQSAAQSVTTPAPVTSLALACAMWQDAQQKPPTWGAITPDGEDCEHPSWSPDGRQIAFNRNRNGHPMICIVDFGKRSLRELTTGMAPAWSPDGQKIAFRRYVRRGIVGFTDADLFVINVDGTGEKRFTQTGDVDDAISWSPDSRDIVFSWNPDGRPDIYVISAEETHLRRLTHNQGNTFEANRWPAWSPAGDKIVFQHRGSEEFGLCVMEANGSNVRPLKAEGYSACWSPDGTKIICLVQSELWMMDAKGKRSAKIPLPHTFFHLDSPAWSKAGWLAVNGDNRIYLMKLAPAS